MTAVNIQSKKKEEIKKKKKKKKQRKVWENNICTVSPINKKFFIWKVWWDIATEVSEMIYLFTRFVTQCGDGPIFLKHMNSVLFELM